MTTLEKQELVRLLNLYQSELVKKNEENIKEASNCRKNNQRKWDGEYFHGIKAQYEHAHCIIAKMSVEIQKEMKSYWNCEVTSMELEWPKNQKFRPSDMIPVTHNGKVIGLLKAIHEYGVEVVVWKGNDGLELKDDKIVACEILSEPHDY